MSHPRKSNFSDHAFVRIIKIFDSCVIAYHAAGSKEKASKKGKHSKIRLNKRNTYLFKELFIISFISTLPLRQVLPYIIKAFDRREEINSQQLINRWWSNFFDFSRFLLVTAGTNWSSLNVFPTRCSKAVKKIDERNHALKRGISYFCCQLTTWLEYLMQELL